jgi:hypothetical protein
MPYWSICPTKSGCMTYDLNSTVGTWRDNEAVSGRSFLDGVHTLTVGSVGMDVAARADLLV